MSGLAETAGLQRKGAAGLEIDVWYQRYGHSVLRRCTRLCGDAAQGWDLTQEVFLRAHRYRASFQERSSPLTWLFRLADRCFFDTLGKPRPLPLDELAEFLAEESDGLEREFARHQLVAQLLAHCEPDVRAIIVHRYFDELDLAAIAKVLDMHERTVRRKLQRFLNRAARLAGGAP